MDQFDHDYVNHYHMEQFSDALAEDDKYSPHISSLNDWAPVNHKLRKRHKKQEEMGEGFGFTLLRWPSLILIGIWVTILATFYALVRIYVAFYEYAVTWRGERNNLRKELRDAKTYNQWVKNAKKLDQHLGLDKWRSDPSYAYYDSTTVLKLIKTMRLLRSQNKQEELATVLQTCVKENFAGTQGAALYSQCYYGTKDAVKDFNMELCKSIRFLAAASVDNEINPQSKRILFKLFSKNYGKSALCLSGGATFTYRHFGVVKALLEQNLLPNIVTGTSGGGLIAALVCTRTNEELKELLVPRLADKITACHEKFPDWLIRMYKTGARFDAKDWAERSCWFTMGSLTFKEAYQRTGKILNISTVPADPHSPAILCNYITSPDCVIWSALLASAAVPGILNPVVLMMKTKNDDIVPFSFGNKWKDGSLRTDIPVQALNNYFNVKFTIVSQVNPHISLFVYAPRGTIGRPVSHRRGKGWRGGFVGSAIEDILKLEIRKWLKLMKNLNLMPRLLDQDWSSVWLQQFHGNVTLWPKIKLADFWNILADPNREKMAEMIQGGEQCAYPRINYIRHQLNIEKEIEQGKKMYSSSSMSSASDNEGVSSNVEAIYVGDTDNSNGNSRDSDSDSDSDF